MHEEIQSRLAFMEMDEAQCRTLQGLGSLVRSVIGGALDRFYARARATPETRRFFRDEAHIAQARAAQDAHWQNILSGRFDQAFVESVRRIGRTHARIGLEPRWYIGAYALLLEEIVGAIVRRASPLGRLFGRRGGQAGAGAAAAVLKAALLDMELSISIYFEEAQQERNRAIAALGAALERLAQGDLTVELETLPPAFAELERSYRTAAESMHQAISGVVRTSETLRTGSDEIAQASDDLARRTEQTAASLEQTSASLGEMDSRLRAGAAAAAQTVQRADGAIVTVSGGRAVAEEAVQAMGRVSDSAKGIDSVIEGLDKISFQTRVLAMNAAVEAGRAGEAGRGFAVVADLVSALAMRAEEEAKRARDQLTITQADIGGAVEAVRRVDGALSQIAGDVGEVHALLGRIAEDNQAQSTSISQISAAMGEVDRFTQQNAARVEQTSAAARSLRGEVNELGRQAARFVVVDTGARAGVFALA